MWSQEINVQHLAILHPFWFFFLSLFYVCGYLNILSTCMYAHHAGSSVTKVMDETGVMDRVIGISHHVVLNVGPTEQQVSITANPYLI